MFLNENVRRSNQAYPFRESSDLQDKGEHFDAYVIISWRMSIIYSEGIRTYPETDYQLIFIGECGESVNFKYWDSLANLGGQTSDVRWPRSVKYALLVTDGGNGKARTTWFIRMASLTPIGWYISLGCLSHGCPFFTLTTSALTLWVWKFLSQPYKGLLVFGM